MESSSSPDKVNSTSNLPRLTVEQASALESTFKLLANQTRLRLIHLLAQTDGCNVSDLAETFNLSTQSVSNQLRLLEGAGVLQSKRTGKQIFYSLSKPSVGKAIYGMLASESEMAE
jgi:ArsR family transcriptional regulator, lead/cadmium/zinc/bismuth-responsive transcriptional repressor